MEAFRHLELRFTCSPMARLFAGVTKKKPDAS
jgi:hypothetical protein